MRVAVRSWLLAVGVVASTASAGIRPQRGEAAQAPPTAGRPDSAEAAATKPVSRKQKATARLREDLAKIEANLRQTHHAYRGRLTFQCQANAPNLHRLELDFTGANNRTLQWFSMDDWRVVSRGTQAAVAKAQQPWGKPQGDSPDVPLSPLLIVPHLATAELGLPTPSEHKGRPALRVRARWRGKPATRALYAATVPSTQHEQLLEALGRAAAKDQKQLFMVDATMLYDPATRRWLSSTLRFSYLDGREIPADVQPPPSPEGMPELTSFPMIETIWRLERCDPEDAALPKLDQRACELLKVDAAGKPVPEPAEQKRDGAGKAARI